MDRARLGKQTGGKETAVLGTLVWDKAFQLPYKIVGRIMLSLLASHPAQIAQIL